MYLEDPELLNEFVVESQEHLASVESQLLSLEGVEGPIDVSIVNKVFRAVHSIKGAAGFLSLQTLETLAHRGEEVLNRLRNNEIRPTSEVINTLLHATDRLKELLDSIATSNEEDITEHVTALERLLEASKVAPLETFACDESAIVNAKQPYVALPIVAESCAQEPLCEQGAAPAAAALHDFIVESMEILEQLERDLVALERDPSSDELLNAIFRHVHSIKGSAGFIAFHRIEKITHAAESLLGCLRSGEIDWDAEISSALFNMIDSVRRYIASIEKTGSEGTADCDRQVELLTVLLAEKRKKKSREESQPNQLQIKKTVGGNKTLGETSGENNHPTPAPASPDSPMQSAADTTIRVDVALLDKLMTRVGELVLARNQILQFNSLFENNDFVYTTQRLNLITTELQEGVMKTRMQQIGNVWSKFPRMVRDLSAICGKEVRIEMEGKETELDKTIIEAIKDPLTHLVRNTVDHGIETPDVRRAKGKSPEGCLLLRAYHEGGQVNIEISDDGAGLNLERIKQKAVEKGLLTEEKAQAMQSREISQLIFLPGFSTAEKVSNVSGRGVGMDVVKTNIEKIGGTIDLQTNSGAGTTVKIKIPLTLAIIPALIVSTAGHRFAIPQVNLLELVRLEGDAVSDSIELIHGAPVYRLRGRLLPLVYLRKVLKTEARHAHSSQADAEAAVNIVVLKADDRQFGLVVDRISDTEEIVVKPLSPQLKNVSVYSGATIMGDGKVALILDVLGLAHNAGVLPKDRDRSGTENSSKSTETVKGVTSLLILATGHHKRLALPISQVARLEKIPLNSIEFTDNQEVVQYRGEILPLIRLAQILGIKEPVEDLGDFLNVVVYISNGQGFGLVVTQIVDIVETHVEISRPSTREGLLGSAIINDRVTDLVDLPKIIQHIVPRLKP
jgi:two-component system, chemotaxis family, sensor kinase CheA